MHSFLTISGQVSGLYKEKGSRFLAFAFPVNGEEEIKDLLLVLKKDHPKSRHICYAYRLGADKNIIKSSDDGEPHNSAGTPILGQIRSFELTNILVAVVRYFGGTKLGVGGLTAAYKEAAFDALQSAKIVEDIERENICLKTDYNGLPDLMHLLKQNNIRILDQNLAETCLITVSVPKDTLKAISNNLKTYQIPPLI